MWIAVFFSVCFTSLWAANAAAMPLAPRLGFSPELAESLPLLQADQVHQLGITGAGVAVAVVDIFSPNPKDPCGSAHGVWIEGLVQGVAPDAGIERFEVRTVPAKNRKACYTMDSSDINRALAQILEHHQTHGIRVVNLSWGGGQYTHPCSGLRNETTRLIQALIRAGVVVVAAAGNNGFSNALIWPACLPEAISVGASFDYNGNVPERTAHCTKAPAVDAVTCYSNTAAFLDVLAPGSRASLSSGLSGVGTSASAAYVSGIVALMLQANPGLSPDDVRSFLIQTGNPVKDDRNGLTFPRVDALRAVQAVLPQGRLASVAPLKGDVNQDGQLDRQDVLTLLSALGGRFTLTPEQRALADVAQPCDGVPSFADYHHLKRMLTGQAAECGDGETPDPATLTRLGAVFLAQRNHGIFLRHETPSIRSMRLTVFNLSGQIVYTGETARGNALWWGLRDRTGRRVPNGVYLFVIRAWGGTGAPVATIQRVAVLR